MVSRARCSALFVAGTEAPTRSAVSAAESPSTSRPSRAARWRPGSAWSATRNASSMVSRSAYVASGPRASSGYAVSHGTSAGDSGARRPRERIRSRQVLVAIR